MEWNRRGERRCPNCGSKNTAPVIWGYPSGDGMRAAERGDVFLGGCMVGFDDPHYGCHDCRASFWSDRRFHIERDDEVVSGVAVWPAGRRPIRVELTTSGVLMADPGRWSVIVPETARHGLFGIVWQDIWGGKSAGPVEWCRRRNISLESGNDGSVIEFAPHHFDKVQLLGLKDWLRTFGADPVDELVAALTDGEVGFLSCVAERPRENHAR
ncbi:MAG: hypothetical protein OEM66_00175 [Acidimicrobiia bacterium]|nr:hypothetical protein [Acidimicrobiia bacterium]